ncbi:hypothetical protein K8R61_02945, partial [bacterium]|nr:hypothetical protein [bacterium]
MSNEKTSSNNSEIKQGKVCAMLAYLLIGVIWYFADEKMGKNNFVKFHVKQGLVLLILSLGGAILLNMLFLLWLIPLYNLVILVFVIIGIINANNEKKKE